MKRLSSYLKLTVISILAFMILYNCKKSEPEAIKAPATQLTQTDPDYYLELYKDSTFLGFEGNLMDPPVIWENQNVYIPAFERMIRHVKIENNLLTWDFKSAAELKISQNIYDYLTPLWNRMNKRVKNGEYTLEVVDGKSLIMKRVSVLSDQPPQEIQLSTQEKDAVIKAAEKVSASATSKLNKLFEEWTKERRTNSLTKYSSDTRIYAKLPQFEQMKAMGTEIIPVILEKMLNEKHFPLLVLYDAIQSNDKMKVSYKNGGIETLEGEQNRAIRTIRIWLKEQNKLTE